MNRKSHLARAAAALALLTPLSETTLSAQPRPAAGAADPQAAPEPPSDAVLSERLQNYIDSFARSGLFSGVVLVQRNGETVFAQAYGTAERAFNVPLSIDTRFQIASLSKPITSAAIGRLVDQGKLTFETRLGELVPGIPNGDRISVAQLLTHYSGLDSPDRVGGSGEWMRLPQTTEQLVARVREMQPLFEPGERYEYSNGNYWILAHIIERLSGVSYGEFLRREIFEPLGMTGSGHRADLLAVVPNLAPGYQLDSPTRWRVAELVDWTSKTGNGSIYSTAADLMLFYRALDEGRLLSQPTTDRIFGVGQRFGYAWYHRNPTQLGRGSVRFNGRSPGYTSYLEGFRDDHVSFVILSNLYVHAPTVMAEGVAAILWGRPYQAQQPIALQPVSAEALRAHEGTYRFGPNFFVRNGTARISAEGDHLKMHWSVGGLTTVLLPIGPDQFFDPTFWATIQFTGSAEAHGLRYQTYGFQEIHEAQRTP